MNVDPRLLEMHAVALQRAAPTMEGHAVALNKGLGAIGEHTKAMNQMTGTMGMMAELQKTMMAGMKEMGASKELAATRNGMQDLVERMFELDPRLMREFQKAGFDVAVGEDGKPKYNGVRDTMKSAGPDEAQKKEVDGPGM